jgi:hypothetical protein
MKEGAEGLKFVDCLNTINDLAWISNEYSKNNYPLFLYLNFNFENNETSYIKIFEYLMRVFSTRLMDKKYSFSGRNGSFNISHATLKEALNKIIFITNNYPTYSVLDELINSSTNSLNHDFNINLYKKSYVDYPFPDGPGLSQDYNKNDILNNCKKNIFLFYTNPNDAYTNNQQTKAGLYNPHFQDCAQYGVQGTLMYLFVPDNNFKLWKEYFENMNNFQPVLKEEILRYIDVPIPVINKQNEKLALTKPVSNSIVTDGNGQPIISSIK